MINLIKKILQETIKNKLPVNEASYSRVWQHINNPEQTFAIVSAYQWDNSPDKNQANHERLKKIVRSLNYGFNELIGGYTYYDDDLNDKVSVQERSLFIPQMRKQEIISLGKIFNQQSVIFKDSEMFGEIDIKSEKVIRNYVSGTNKDFTFNPEVIKRAYTQFVKSKNKNQLKKFQFNQLQEKIIPSRTDAILSINNKDLPKTKYINIL
jgi:hypothetical protein